MRRWVLGLAVAFVAAGVAAADEKAEAVVKKAIEAHGGADALNKYKAGKFKMKGEFSVMGLDFEFTGNVSYMLPDRYKVEVNADVSGMKLVINQVVKGESVKTSGTIGGMAIPMNSDAEKAEVKMAAVIQEAEQLTPLLDAKKFTIKAGEEETVNDKKASVVIATPKALDKELKIYFDKESGLVVKTAHKGLGAGAGGPVEVMEESYHSEYKKINGVQTATKLKVTHDGNKFMTAELSDIEVLEKIDDKEFTIDD
jgi:outer membrane lipoprotein-sorting protein